MAYIGANFSMESITGRDRSKSSNLMEVGDDEPNVAATIPRHKAEELKEGLVDYAQLGGELAELYDTLDSALEARLDNGQLSETLILGARQVGAVAMHFAQFGPPASSQDAVDHLEAYSIVPLNYS